MNMVRISVQPHQLEAILNIVAGFNLETVTVREVRELEPGVARSIVNARGVLTQAKAQLELFVPELMTAQLLSEIRHVASASRPTDAMLLNCETYQREKPVRTKSPIAEGDVIFTISRSSYEIS